MTGAETGREAQDQEARRQKRQGARLKRRKRCGDKGGAMRQERKTAFGACGERSRQAGRSGGTADSKQCGQREWCRKSTGKDTDG